MNCIVIKGPTLLEAQDQILKGVAWANLFEFRLDYFESLEIEQIKQLRALTSLPVIFTLRKPGQEDEILKLASLEPNYIDVDVNDAHSLIEKISHSFPKIKLILSHHDFEGMPEDLDQIFQSLKKFPAHFYKIACMANSTLDACRLIAWKKQTPDQLIAISMGCHGQISRILSSFIESPWTYSTLGNGVNSIGQLSSFVLRERYRHAYISPKTEVYGLIGDPVDQSISNETHNAVFKAFDLNAVYLKMQVKPLDLCEFLKFAKQLAFFGLSVTMPLKETIIPFLDYLDPEAACIGAVNTLCIKEGKIYGYNTDGFGALNAIEKKGKVANKHIVILGAGGSSKAIAYEGKKRGAKITLLNRDQKKAENIAEKLHCSVKGLDQMAECANKGYDILINCTPAEMPISAEHILNNSIVMDIVTKPMVRTFLKHALEKNCQVIYGYEMFIEQALGQFELWLNDQINIAEARKILEKEVIILI